MKENKKQEGCVVAVSTSRAKGVKKQNVSQARLIEQVGIENDAHAGSGIREVSLLAEESIEKIKKKLPLIKPGNFAENITTRGIEISKLPVGTQLKIGGRAVLIVSQIGKECHARCRIYYEAGDCVMPKEGVFARVVTGGIIKPGDTINVA